MQGSSSSLDERLPDSADRIPLVDENMQLYRALRNGAGPPCTKPWVSFEERSSQGMVKPCCWLQGTLGRLRRFGVYADFVIQEFNYRHLTRFVELCSDVGLTPNFTLVGDNREATRRSLIQNTELGARPCDIGDLTEHLDAAIARADVLKLNFAARSLDRVRRAFHPMPMDPAQLA